MGTTGENMDADGLNTLIQFIHPTTRRRESVDRPAVSVPVADLLPLLASLRNHDAFQFDLLMSHTAVDYPGAQQFEAVYLLYSTLHGHWVIVTTLIDRNSPVLPTAIPLWPIAEWQEREVYDLFGILYDGHPDLRRIFLEDDWEGFPLRKDYQDEDMLEMRK